MLAAVQEMDHDRDAGRHQPIEEGGVGESEGEDERYGHGRLPLSVVICQLSLWLIARYYFLTTHQ